MTLIERIDNLCKEKGISRRRMESDAGLAIGTTSRWKGEFKPSQKSLQRLSEFFGVSIAYLTGESDYRSDRDALIDKWTEQNVSEFGQVQAGIRIPVLGEVPCGIPIEAIEIIGDDWEEISEKLARTGTYFGLKAKGDSMFPRIQEGDVLIVRQQEDAESGDVVIAKVNGNEATCKKLVKTDSGIVLQSFNPVYDPMIFSADDIVNLPVKIIGKVVENRQKY